MSEEELRVSEGTMTPNEDALSLRARLIGGERLLGVLVRMPSEDLVEMAAVAGFDFVVIDCEHGPADILALRHHLVIAESHRVPVIVRVGQGDEGMILRVLDQGAAGILAPHLDTPEEAADLVASCHYPPVGRRGFATYSRAGRFGQVTAAAHRDRNLSDTLVLGMIESPAGVAAAEGIARVPGLDGIMIGPADLAAASGPKDLPVAQASVLVHAALAAAGRLRVDIVGSTEAAAQAFGSGANLVVYNLTHALMTVLRAMTGARPANGRPA